MGDLLAMEKVRRTTDLATVGAVPIGVPLIVGPAVLTTTMLLVSQHGVLPTVAATVFNIAIAGAIFWFSEAINRVLGSAGAKTISKLASLLLASIAVMMVRKGVVTIFSAIAAAKS
jgi:multiple antibiotic resistance protein